METQIFFLSPSSFFPLTTISFSMNSLLLGIMLNPLGETKIKNKKERKSLEKQPFPQEAYCLVEEKEVRQLMAYRRSYHRLGTKSMSVYRGEQN